MNLNQNHICLLDKIFGKGIFSQDEVNTGRQLELDIAKGFAIVFMVWIHTTDTFGNPMGLGSLIVDNILGGPFAAPVFMICMGIGMCYTRRNTAYDFAKRGVILIIIGFLLNVFRYALPLSAVYLVTGETEILSAIFPFMFGVDIMEFAGLAFLFFALVKKFNISNKLLVIIAIFSSVAGMLLVGTETGLIYIDQFLAYIWGNANAEVYFPFLNWIIFPIFGYLFGNLLRHCNDKKTFYLKSAPICGLIGLGYIVSALLFSFGMYGENGYYYFLGLIDAIAVIFLVIGIFGFDFILTKFKDSFIVRALCDMSRNINTVYCIQWIIIGNAGILLSWIFPEEGLSFIPMTLLALIILICSALLAHWYQKHKFFNF